MRANTKVVAVISRPVAVLCLASILWSFSGVLIKLLNCHAFVIAGARAGIAIIIQLGFLRLVGARLKLPRDRIQWLAIAASVSNVFLLVFAFQLTSAANAVFLHYSGIV